MSHFHNDFVKQVGFSKLPDLPDLPKIGYARVSTEHQQDISLQTDLLEQAECDFIYSEKISSFMPWEQRTELQKALAHAKSIQGVLVFYKICRICRDIREAQYKLAPFLCENNIAIYSLKEPMLNILFAKKENQSASEDLFQHFNHSMLFLIAAFSANLERITLAQRTQAGKIKYLEKQYAKRQKCYPAQIEGREFFTPQEKKNVYNKTLRLMEEGTPEKYKRFIEIQSSKSKKNHNNRLLSVIRTAIKEWFLDLREEIEETTDDLIKEQIIAKAERVLPFSDQMMKYYNKYFLTSP